MTDIAAQTVAPQIVEHRLPSFIVAETQRRQTVVQTRTQQLVAERGVARTVIHASGAQGPSGIREVYAQDVDPVVSQPSINFPTLAGHITVRKMRVFVP